MSLKAMVWAFEARIENTGAKFLLVALAEHASDRAGEDWTCFPGAERLMQFTSQSKRTVGRHVDWLAGEGWISHQQEVVGGRYQRTLYTLHKDPVVRGKLRAERQDIEFPSANMAADNPEFRAPESTDSARQFGDEPSVNLSGPLIEEPSLEPSNEPGARAASRKAAATQQGLAGGLTVVPSRIRNELVADPRYGEPWVVSWIDPCRFDPQAQAIVARSTFARGRLAQEIGPRLKAWGVSLGEPVAGKVRP